MGIGNRFQNPRSDKLNIIRPYATVVKPKKKRKRGYDSSDEMNATDTLQGTPPPSPEDSLVEVSGLIITRTNAIAK